MVAEERKHISIDKFVRSGYLQEANRRFFHPLGLALEIKRETLPWYRRLWLRTKSLLMRTHLDNEAAKWRPWMLSGVQDYRNDPEGMIFGGDYLATKEALEKAGFVAAEMDMKAFVRKKRLGYIIQPLGGKVKEG